MNKIKSLVLILTLSVSTNQLMSIGEHKSCKGKFELNGNNIWHKCIGKSVTDTGYIYQGEFQFNKPHGYGTFTNSDSVVVYEGEWRDGRFDGQGTYLLGKAKYIGELIKGEVTGQGTWYYTNGAVYEGSVKNALKHGVGTYSSGEELNKLLEI